MNRRSEREELNKILHSLIKKPEEMRKEKHEYFDQLYSPIFK